MKQLVVFLSRRTHKQCQWKVMNQFKMYHIETMKFVLKSNHLFGRIFFIVVIVNWCILTYFGLSYLLITHGMIVENEEFVVGFLVLERLISIGSFTAMFAHVNQMIRRPGKALQRVIINYIDKMGDTRSKLTIAYHLFAIHTKRPFGLTYDRTCNRPITMLSYFKVFICCSIIYFLYNNIFFIFNLVFTLLYSICHSIIQKHGKHWDK